MNVRKAHVMWNSLQPTSIDLNRAANIAVNNAPEQMRTIHNITAIIGNKGNAIKHIVLFITVERQELVYLINCIIVKPLNTSRITKRYHFLFGG